MRTIEKTGEPMANKEQVLIQNPFNPFLIIDHDNVVAFATACQATWGNRSYLALVQIVVS